MKPKGFWLKMAPVIVLVVVTLIMSMDLYVQMIRTEEEVCWNRLEIATNSTAGKIATRINDNMKFLEAVSETYTLTHKLDDPEAVGRHLTSVKDRTIFDRLDVILPDDRMLTGDGEIIERGGKQTYAELTAEGSHITQRRTSSFTGREVICCVMPIEREDQQMGLLVGTIDCEDLSNIFEVFIYGKAGQLFLIDRTDGQYLMDNWHQELGNVYDMGLRELADGSGTVDLTQPLINGERVRFAYISKTNGETSYQYSAPVEGFNWTVCVVVQEDVAFANLQALQHKLMIVGIVELIVVLIYVLWNVVVNIYASRSEEKVKRLEYEKAKNDARATFISNMSHDIKTPLNGIVGMLQIIKNHRDEADTVDDCLKKIEISAQYLSTLTSDMLDISEIENDKLVLPTEPIDLMTLADEVASIMERQAKDAGVTFAMDCVGLKNPCVMGSSVHIKRILVNLIGNAIKYSKDAGKNVWVTVADEPAAQEHSLVRFIIKDNGVGMSEEFQKNMYSAFEQEAISARSEYQGYGLGLTIVSHLIKKMGGAIELESQKGVGSTFTVTIPLKRDVGCTCRVNVSESPKDLSGMRLLLVEDNEFNMEIAQVLLTDAGAAVDTAADGQIATEIFAASAPGTYNAIIMDVMMPVMDGCEASQVIRAMDRADAASVPIIAMTASTFSEDIARCMASGMNAHVPKPLDLDLLLRTINGFGR